MNSEDQLVKEAIHKRTDAIKLLYERHAPALLSLCLRYCGNIEDAEDVLHEGFIKIIKNIHTFRIRKNGTLMGWMKRIMVNTSLNYLRNRSKKNHFIAIDPLIETIMTVEDEETDLMITPDNLSQDLVMKMICDLPTGYRTVLNLYVFEEYSHREIADILKFSENTSKSQLSKARAMLKKKLNQIMIEQTT